MARTLRIKWEYEQDPDYSWLEQWDTPEKYYGETPMCSHGNSMKYVERHEWASDCYHCEDAGALERTTFDGGSKGAMCVDIDGKQGGVGPSKLIPFETYRAYFGNPGRHVFLCALVEEQCECCGSWSTIDALGNIDLMDTDPYEIGTYTDEDAKRLKGYQGEVSQELLREAKAQVTAAKR